MFFLRIFREYQYTLWHKLACHSKEMFGNWVFFSVWFVRFSFFFNLDLIKKPNWKTSKLQLKVLYWYSFTEMNAYWDVRFSANKFLVKRCLMSAQINRTCIFVVVVAVLLQNFTSVFFKHFYLLSAFLGSTTVCECFDENSKFF